MEGIRFPAHQGVPNGMFGYSRNACEITTYADAYYKMSGTTPFSRKDAAGSK